MVRVRERTTVHATIHNLLSVEVLLHCMHQHPGKIDEVLAIPSHETREVTFLARDPGAYYDWMSAGGDTLNGRPNKEDSQMYDAFIVDPVGDFPSGPCFCDRYLARPAAAPGIV